jgi:hypothetical protein
MARSRLPFSAISQRAESIVPHSAWRCAVFTLLCAAVGAPCSVARAQDADGSPGNMPSVAADFESIKQVFADRQNDIRSFRFRWKETIREFKSAAADDISRKLAAAQTEEESALLRNQLKVLRAADCAYDQVVTLTVDGERVQCVQVGQRPDDSDPGKALRPFRFVEAFDGSASTLYFPPENLDLKEPFAELHAGNQTGGLQYIGASPLMLTYRGLDWVRTRRDGGMFDETRVRTAVDGNRLCVVVGATATGHSPTECLWIDPAGEARVIRRVSTVDGTISTQLDISYSNDERSGWVPTEWQSSTYFRDGTLRMHIDASVIEYELNPEVPTDAFTVALAPGTRVTDVRTRASYRVGADGTPEPIARPARLQAGSTFWTKMLVVNGLLVCTFLAAWLVKLYRRRRMS